MTESHTSAYRLSDTQMETVREKRQSARVILGTGVPLTAQTDRSLAKSQFVVVETHDISQTGMSFYATEVPESESLVLMMGGPGNPLYLSATVVHCRIDAEDPQQRYVVGCEFRGEIK